MAKRLKFNMSLEVKIFLLQNGVDPTLSRKTMYLNFNGTQPLGDTWSSVKDHVSKKSMQGVVEDVKLMSTSGFHTHVQACVHQSTL